MKIAKTIPLLLLILLCLCCERQPQTGISVTQYKDSAGPRNDIIGLGNFARVSENLYRGEQPTKEGFEELKKMGIKTIVNLRANHSDRDKIKGLGFQYLEIPFNAGETNDEDVIKFLKTVTNPVNHPVFVHCQHGSDRTGMMAAIYRMYAEGWTNEKAIAELPNFGFHEIYKDIKTYLKGLNIKTIREKVESAPEPKIETAP